jgi:hypothetical protein
VERDLAEAMVHGWKSLWLASVSEDSIKSNDDDGGTNEEEELRIVSGTGLVMAHCARQVAADDAALTEY